MSRTFHARWLALALLPLLIAPAGAQGSAKAEPGGASAKAADLQTLKGSWVRPDGGYVITISEVPPDGHLKASYFNPNPLPFSQATVIRDGGAVRLFFELRAGGYNGSTYSLTYDPSTDRLYGIYWQAVARQKFDVQFARKP